VKLIRQRTHLAMNDERYKQIIMFPEGTTTNGTAIIKFKPGAFIPGVPLQAVVISYPNIYSDLTWAPNVPLISTIFQLLCQFTNYMDITYLPIYTPNDQEKQNIQLFMNNVRAMMADALNVTVTQHTYDDSLLMMTADKYSVPDESLFMIQLSELEKLYNLKLPEAKQYLKLFSKYHIKGNISIKEFSKITRLTPEDIVNIKLFQFMDKNSDQKLNFTEYLIGVGAIKYFSKEELSTLFPGLNSADYEKIDNLTFMEDKEITEESILLDIS